MLPARHTDQRQSINRNFSWKIWLKIINAAKINLLIISFKLKLAKFQLKSFFFIWPPPPKKRITYRQNDFSCQWVQFHRSQVLSTVKMMCRTLVFYCSIFRYWWKFLLHGHYDHQRHTSVFPVRLQCENPSSGLGYPNH